MTPSNLLKLCLFLFCGLGMSSLSARAESLVADMSDRVIKISSNFTGSNIVVFGMIERDGATVARGEPYDLVVVVRGWNQTIVSRRKERVVGVWINNKRELYPNAPNFYVLSSTRKLEDIAHPEILAKMQLGTDYLLLPSGEGVASEEREPDPFRMAALRLKRNAGLYRDDLSSVAFLNDSLFRTTVDIPANVRVGRYDVTVHLFRGGALLSSVTQPLNIAKTGFEQLTFSLARNNSFIYGVLCVAMAMFMGWFAGVVFRRN
ncbi:conserved hypothetical protein [Cohaesibacter sp. ES.047]|uniref:TIGR02186 family protein n=1 Tax=Cohaesibacter sp. ES.047 TaxID=1798205 RepID=UPI000BB6C3F1|nr:TIGR02186 family protein [Cohaesibacter sp. ES.047]SNY91911.1 conserved hypothetical protein [Cohaesibacter sp. ES.047]